MVSSLYPETRDEADVINTLREMARLREAEDISDFQNLNQRFVRGRSVGRIPTDPDSVLATDQVGDVSNDSLYEYKLIAVTTSSYRWDRRTLNFAW